MDHMTILCFFLNIVPREKWLMEFSLVIYLIKEWNVISSHFETLHEMILMFARLMNCNA